MSVDGVKGSSVHMTMYLRVTECQYYCIYIVRTQYITQKSEFENPELRIKCEK
jgi:hypothetical protein